VARTAPDDVDVLKGIGRALLLGREPVEALKAFERVLQLTPNNAASEEDVGAAFLASGQNENAASHLERAVQLDRLLLSAGTALQAVYRKQGNDNKADALAERMRRTMLNLPRKPEQ
jgi:Flp pilus assembly protein TadD